MNPKIDTYLLDGCMRCKFGGTPECKVHSWQEELKLLRTIVLECGLTEELKWGVPCYTFQNANILIIAAFKEDCRLNFFKGALLHDTQNILKKAGENTQYSRVVRFKNVREIVKLANHLKKYIFEAIEVEKAGLKVVFKKNMESLPEELQHIFDQNPNLKEAFESLTPGRQRGYILHFSQPKQSKTRISRIEKCKYDILNGMGLNDKYKC